MIQWYNWYKFWNEGLILYRPIFFIRKNLANDLFFLAPPGAPLAISTLYWSTRQRHRFFRSHWSITNKICTCILIATASRLKAFPQHLWWPHGNINGHNFAPLRNYMDNTWCHLGVTWVSLGCHFGVAWVSLQCYLGDFWQSIPLSFGKHMAHFF